MNYCSRCGTPIAPTDNFCGTCAAPVPRPAAPAPNPPVGYIPEPNPLAATLQPNSGQLPGGFAAPPPPAVVHAPAPAPMAAPPPAAPGLAAPPFGAPPPGMDAQGGYGGYAPQAPFAPPAQPPFPGPGAAAQPAYAPPAAPAVTPPYGPAPVAPPAASRCDLGHEIPPGSSYCQFGHPIALGEMKIAGGDAFSAPTAFPQDGGGLPPTGPMSPFPQQAPAVQQPPPYGAAVGQPPAYGAAQTPPPGYAAGPSQPPPGAAPWQQQPPAPQPAPAEPVTAPHEAPGRVLRGFLYSFHTDAAGTFWPLYTGRNAAGRAGAGETLEIEIADPTTSSRHASIVCDAASAVLEDDGSTNGTFVNDQPLGYRGKTELHDGDRVRFGAYNAVIRLISR